MNWSIEQNYILLKFVRIYGENEWNKHVTELRDLFSVYLSNPIDLEVYNFNEEDFCRQYNYILATTRQECLKQGVKIVRSTELSDIALKKFYSYLEQQQQNKEEGGQNEDRYIRLLEEGDVKSIGKDRLLEMREKIYRIVGEDILGIAFNLEKLDKPIMREDCVKEMCGSWIRRLSDGRVCVAGDTDVFPEKLLTELYETANISDHDCDSDMTDSLDEQQISIVPNEIISFQDARISAGIYYNSPTKESDCGFVKRYGTQRIIAGWDLTGNQNRAELDERLHIWEDSLRHSDIDLNFNTDSFPPFPTFEQQVVDQRRTLSQLCSPPSSVSTQEAFVSQQTFPVTDSYEVTTGSPSADTALSHATFDDLDEHSSVKESPVLKRKKRPVSKNSVAKSASKEAENKRKIMRNITKMILEHPYSSIFVKNIREDTGIYKQPTLNILKISHDVVNGNFKSYEHFIEVVILFFLQMKIYYLADKETVKKIESVYADVSKQLSIIYPDLNENIPLSDLFQRRLKRFKGNYA